MQPWSSQKIGLIQMKKAQDQQGHLLQYNNSYITGLCPKKQNAIKGSHVRISNKHYFLSRKFDY